MGWLFGKKDDGLYRGDAPATTPGVDGVEPSAYQSSPSGSTYVQPSAPIPYPTDGPYPTGSHYPTNAAPYPNTVVGAGQPNAPHNPVPPPAGQSFTVTTSGSTQHTTTGLPPEFASAWGQALSQQRAIKKTVTRSLLGFLLPLILVGGLVGAGFVLVDKVEEINPFSSGPDIVFEGVMGTPGNLALGDNSYDITISKATAQPCAAWGSFFGSASGGLLVIELSITRTDTNESVSQISWFDWMFTSESEPAKEGELIAGGYEPLLSTLNLAPNETATGLIAFDTTASSGSLSLTTYDGTWAQWPITATVPAVVVGQFGAPVHPEAGNVPFSTVVANPRWIGTGDPAIWIAPSSGNYLVFDVTVTLDEGALAETSSLSLGYDTWQFVPDGGAAVTSYIGVNGADGVTFTAGQATSLGTLIAFDAARSSGTLNLLNSDGSVLASWVVPAL